MILPTELNEQNAHKTKSAAYLSEFNALEKKIDGIIKKYELELLKGEKIHIIIHDLEDEYGAKNDVLNKYKENGWSISSQRSWSALFVDVYLSISGSNGI